MKGFFFRFFTVLWFASPASGTTTSTVGKTIKGAKKSKTTHHPRTADRIVAAPPCTWTWNKNDGKRKEGGKHGERNKQKNKPKRSVHFPLNENCPYCRKKKKHSRKDPNNERLVQQSSADRGKQRGRTGKHNWIINLCFIAATAARLSTTWLRNWWWRGATYVTLRERGRFADSVGTNGTKLQCSFRVHFAHVVELCTIISCCYPHPSCACVCIHL